MRKYIFAIACISLCISCSPTENETSLYKASPFPVGTAISANNLMRESPIQQIALDQFNSITMENDMKMHSVARSKELDRWEIVDSVVRFCVKNNKRLHGHALIWHSSIPNWLRELDGEKESIQAFVETYISEYVQRYKGRVAGWDVVNEALSDSAGTMRQAFWLENLGEDYVAEAFKQAHAADPNAVLFYNDYNIERDTVKLHATLDMIEKLRSEGVPVTGIGLQMHIRMDIPNEVIAYALQKCAETGLQIHISELDIIFNKHNDTKDGGIQQYKELTDSMAMAQGDKYKAIAEMYRTIVPKQQQYGITVWGFDDGGSWIRGFFDIHDWPTLYDDSLNRKPAYYGFLDGLRAPE